MGIEAAAIAASVAATAGSAVTAATAGGGGGGGGGVNPLFGLYALQAQKGALRSILDLFPDARDQAAKAFQSGSASALADLDTSTQNAIATLRKQFTRTGKDLRPFVSAGRDAISLLKQGLVEGDNALNEAFQVSPGFEFRREQGEQALARQQAARGNFLSGQAVKEGTRFSQGLASEEFGNFINRLFNVAGLGLQGTQTKVQQQSNIAGAIAGLQSRSGELRAGIQERGGFNIGNLIFETARQIAGVQQTSAANQANILTGSAAQTPARGPSTIGRIGQGVAGLGRGLTQGISDFQTLRGNEATLNALNRIG